MNQKIGVSSYTSLHAFQEEQNKLFSLSSHTYLAAANKTRIQSNLWLVAEWQNNRLNKRVCVLFCTNQHWLIPSLNWHALKELSSGEIKYCDYGSAYGSENYLCEDCTVYPSFLFSLRFITKKLHYSHTWVTNNYLFSVQFPWMTPGYKTTYANTFADLLKTRSTFHSVE